MISNRTTEEQSATKKKWDRSTKQQGNKGSEGKKKRAKEEKKGEDQRNIETVKQRITAADEQGKRSNRVAERKRNRGVAEKRNKIRVTRSFFALFF